MKIKTIEGAEIHAPSGLVSVRKREDGELSVWVAGTCVGYLDEPTFEAVASICEHGLDTRLPCGDCQKAYEEENAPSSVQSTSLLDDVRTLFHVLYDAPELNPSNYDHDQACELNAAMCEAFALCRDLLNRVWSNTGVDRPMT